MTLQSTVCEESSVNICSFITIVVGYEIGKKLVKYCSLRNPLRKTCRQNHFILVAGKELLWGDPHSSTLNHLQGAVK